LCPPGKGDDRGLIIPSIPLIKGELLNKRESPIIPLFRGINERGMK